MRNKLPRGLFQPECFCDSYILISSFRERQAAKRLLSTLLSKVSAPVCRGQNEVVERPKILNYFSQNPVS